MAAPHPRTIKKWQEASESKESRKAYLEAHRTVRTLRQRWGLTTEEVAQVNYLTLLRRFTYFPWGALTTGERELVERTLSEEYQEEREWLTFHLLHPTCRPGWERVQGEASPVEVFLKLKADFLQEVSENG